MPISKPEKHERHADFLLLGGGIACASAAETLRIEGASGSITMICGEPSLPYQRPALSTILRQAGSAREPPAVLAADFYASHHIDLLLDNQVVEVNARSQRVTTKAGEVWHYDRMLIATGTQVIRLKLPGSDLAGIHYLRTVKDARAIHAEIRPGARAVVIGASFIGMELAASLRQSGVDVTMLVRESRVFDTLRDKRISDFFYQIYRKRGVKVHYDEAVQFTSNDARPAAGQGGRVSRKANAGSRVCGVITAAGLELPCDFVAIGIGVTPVVDFLRGSGIAVDDGVVVDEFLCSNYREVYAAGDVANFNDLVFKVRRRMEHWDNAVKQGQTAAKNMLGQRLRYDEVSYFFGELFDVSYQFFGLPLETDEKSEIGSLKSHSSALLYLREGVLRAVFTTGRPAKETHALQALIRFRTHIGKWLPHLNFPGFQLNSVPAQTVLILQGGGALGAFEWGVVRALEENRISPDIVAGVSIGAFNGAIIASHPGQATKVLKAFWKELAVLTTELPDKRAQQLITSWEIFTLGVPGFFRPRWLNARSVLNELPSEWTYLYDAAPMKSLLLKYVDFKVLKSSPVRLLISAVDVETANLRVFDSYVDELTPEHIIASGSLPLALPWTTIDGRHYWDGGIVSNSPLDQVIERCGAYGKQIFIVDLFPHRKPLPTSLLEVIARRDEIIYAERYRRDSYQRQLVSDYRKLVDETLSHVDPTVASQLQQRPRYIQLMGDDHDQKIMRIMRSDAHGEPASRDYDFSLASIMRLQRSGYHAANLVLGDVSGPVSDGTA